MGAFLAAPNDPAALSSDTRMAVLQLAVKTSGSMELLDRLQKAHDATKDEPIRLDIYSAIGEGQTPELRKRVLEWSLTLPASDSNRIPNTVAKTRAGAEELFEWVK